MAEETPKESYEAVALLAEAEQRSLVQCGDAQERVWAAWALGQRLGSSGGELFLEGLRHDPPSGTRMHLAALLAGAGETDAVLALAAHDPSGEVRATAAQYLVKTSAAPNPPLAAFLSERLRVEGSTVRLRVLVERPGRIGELEPEVLARCAADPHREVRALALAEMETLPRELASRLLTGRLAFEDDAALRSRLVDITLEGADPAEVLHAALRSTVENGHALLGALAERGLTFEWSRLVALVERRAPSIDSGVLAVVRDPERPAAVRWLVAGIAHALRLPRPRRREEFREQAETRRFAHEALTLLRPKLGTWSLEEAREDDLRVVLDHLETDLEDLLDGGDDEEDFDLDAELRERWRQCNAIRGRLGIAPGEPPGERH